MLSSGVPPRKPFLTVLMDLYKAEPAFRGMAEFAAIGIVVMAFLSPPQKVVWPWSGGATPPQSCVAGTPGCGTAGLPSSGTGGSLIIANTSGPVVPIPFTDVIKAPKLSLGFMFDLDDAPFRSSSGADQPRLKAARTSIVYRRSEEATEHLRAASGSDANVALVRGAAFILRDTADTNKSAEALWRAALIGGNKQAAGLLGRLLISGRAGIAANAAEGQRLIESGASAGDRQAMRFAGMGYLSGEFGRLDPFKAAQYFKQSADAGDAMSAAFFARLAAEGIAMAAPDGKLAEVYLRKAANAGLTNAQVTMGNWLSAQYQRGLISDLKEASDWFLRAYHQGHDIDALNGLTFLHESVAQGPPWKDLQKGFDYARLCSGFSQRTCQFNTAIGWERGQYGAKSLAMARAHYAIAAGLNYANAASQLKRVDGFIPVAEMEASARFETTIRSALKPIPPVIGLQEPGVPSPAVPVAIGPDLVGGGNSLAKGVSQTNTGQHPVATANHSSPATAPGTPDLKACQTTSTEATLRLQACTRVIQAATSSNADIADAHNRRGDIHMNSNRYNAAFADYAEAVKRVSNNAIYLYDRARAQNARGNTKPALEDYEASLRINSNYVLALAGRADAWRQLGNFADAMTSVNKALDIAPRNHFALETRGNIHADAGRSNDALKDFQLSASIADHTGYPHFRTAGILFDSGQFNEAINQLDQAINQHAYNDARAIILKARSQAGNRNFPAADATFASLIQREPNNSLAYQWRGTIRFAEWSAINDWCKGGRKGPAPVPNATSHEYIGGSGNSLCTGPQGVEPALKDLNMAIAKDGNNSDAHFHAARVLVATKNLTGAAQAYSAAIRIKPTSGAHSNRGSVYEDLGQPELAIGDFNEAIRLDARNKFAWASRASFLAKRNRQQAIADYRRALDIDPNYAFAMNGLRNLGVRP